VKLTVGRWWLNQLIILDVGVNALIGGDPYEPISSVVGKMQRAGNKWGIFWARIIDGIFGKDHCKNNIKDCEGQEASLT